jgi:hypothetical protein
MVDILIAGFGEVQGVYILLESNPKADGVTGRQ